MHFLEEACEDKDILQLVVDMQPTMDHLGEIGHPLLLKYVLEDTAPNALMLSWPSDTYRFMSTPMGFRFLYDAGYIDREMDMWFHVCSQSCFKKSIITVII